ncbi:hypothetical protein LCGC14_1847370 [marine sediment metagenome]|uniref:Uncharacterized protein n=1 Tax=marine sediment metagenome TaxID=412755 RepID=A0A0F9JAL4_9ZZZZ
MTTKLEAHRREVRDAQEMLEAAKKGAESAAIQAWPPGSRWRIPNITHGVTIDAEVLEHRHLEIVLRNLKTEKERRTYYAVMLNAEPLE